MSDETKLMLGSATVQDAMVRFRFGASNPPELVVHTDTLPDLEEYMPARDSTVPDDNGWIGSVDRGIFKRYQIDPAQPPADTSPKTTRHEILHEDGRVEDRVISFSHVTKKYCNKEVPESVLEVNFKPADGYSTSLPVRVELAELLVREYVNGDLGTDVTSETWYNREIENNHSWRRLAVADRSDVKPYAQCNVELVYDDIYTWVPKRISDIEPGDVGFHPDRTYYAVISEDYGSTRRLRASEDDAQEYIDGLRDGTERFRVQEVGYMDPDEL